MISNSINDKRLLADLYWLRNSASLFSTTTFQSYLPFRVTDATNFLLDSIIPDNDIDLIPAKRLGYYFEQLWCLAIKTNPKIKEIRANLQVFIEGQTAGEFDTLLETVSGQCVHVELTAKFYLQIGAGNKMSDWYGPNLKDRLDIKYHRLANHQLRLSMLPGVSDWLTNKGYLINQTALLSRGRLFYPYEQLLNNEFRYPEQINQHHQNGFWIRYSDPLFEEIQSRYQCYTLPKPFWLAEISPDDLSQLGPLNADIASHCQQFVCMQNNREIMRGFLVTDNWLDEALDQHHQLNNDLA